MPWKPLPESSDKQGKDFEREFRKKARFLIDENVNPVITEFLTEKGWNAKDASEMGLAGKDDRTVLAAAHREDRVLLTHDRDFLDDRQYPPHRNPGVVVLPLDTNFTALAAVVHNMLLLVGRYRNFQRGTKVEFFPDGSLVINTRNLGKNQRTRYRFTRNGQAEIWEDE
jgi:predicted nuclease of predicted toxin-antitoxin system